MKCGLAAMARRGEGAARDGPGAARAGPPAVGRRGGVHGQRRAADDPRGLPRRRRGDRRAVRRRDHHVAGGRAVVPRRRCAGCPGHAAASGQAVNAIENSLQLIRALRVLEAELNADPPPPYDRLRAPDRAQRRHDPRRRLALDGARRVHGRVPDRGVPGHVDRRSSATRDRDGRRATRRPPTRRRSRTSPRSSTAGSARRGTRSRTTIRS